MDRDNAKPEPMEKKGGTTQENNNMEAARGERKHNKSTNKEFNKETIKASGKSFLKVFQKLLRETNANKEVVFKYMQRVYHAIFFFGHINDPQVAPKEFIPAKTWGRIQILFQKPLAEYNTHLPSKTPFSILLEYINKHYGGEKKSILEELEKRITELWGIFYDDQNNQLNHKHFALSSAVISHSCIKDPYSDNELKTAYGSSIAYKGKVPREIMIGISTLLVWDRVISYEVRCEEHGRGIHFPNDVCCYSYRFEATTHKYKEKSPCTKCKKMYNIKFFPKYRKPDRQEHWRYGNCAETESLSNLIEENKNIKNALYTSDKNEEIMSRADITKRFTTEHEGKLQKRVTNLLVSRKFDVKNNGLKLFDLATSAQI